MHRSSALLPLVVVCAFGACSETTPATTSPTADTVAGTDTASIPDAIADTGPTYATEFTAVSLDPSSPAPFQLAVRACVGLYNRDVGGSVFVRMDGDDEEWLEELSLTPKETIEAAEFLDTCVAAYPCVPYSYATQQELLPAILTVGTATGAVPLDKGLSVTCTDVAVDGLSVFAENNTPVLATRYALSNHIDQTTGLAMLNPGYDPNATDLANPPLNRDIQAHMVDFIFSHRLFVVFLINGCEDAGSERDVLYDVVNHGGWPTPVGVYGYNDSWLVGGYLHEAQSRCLDSRNMGAIPTKTGNISFFGTRRPAISESVELPQNPPEAITYDPNKTYVAFVVGDGDNVRFMLSTRKTWLRQRMADCAKPAGENSCAPLNWSMSPHLPHLGPDVLHWYYEAAQSTGKDYFVLPPSGHQYAYPTSLSPSAQDAFVAATERDARLLGVTGIVHWDWLDTWEDAEAIFLPKYANADGPIRGIFPVNVPYPFPMFTWWPEDQYYNVLEGPDGGKTVVFKPRSWRGVNDSGTGGDAKYYINPQLMADELASHPPGTVTWVYMTSDGGLNLENAFMQLVPLLADHVQLVSTDAAARLAIEATP